MHRSARLLVVLLALVTSGGVMYWAFQDERGLRQSAVTERQALDIADHALATTADLRAALQAYVAAGQGPEFWMSRSDALMQDLQKALVALTPPGDEGAPALAAEAMGRLVGADKRARAFVRERQERLAADVVFIECRNHLEAVRLQIAGAREREIAAAAGRATVLRREQYVLVTLLVAVWFVAAFLLLPAPISEPTIQASAPVETAARTARPAAHASTAAPAPAAASSPQDRKSVV